MSRYASAVPLHEWREERPRRRRRKVQPAAPRRAERQPRRDLAPVAPMKGPRVAGDELEGVRDGLRRAAGKVTDALTPGWGPDVEAGSNLRVRARKGFRAAVVEVKPGLYVVAEVPERAVEFGFGPLLLAPALAKTLGRAFRRNAQKGSVVQHKPRRLALPGPTEDDEAGGDDLPRWLDDEDAAELGCALCEREQP